MNEWLDDHLSRESSYYYLVNEYDVNDINNLQFDILDEKYLYITDEDDKLKLDVCATIKVNVDLEVVDDENLIHDSETGGINFNW